MWIHPQVNNLAAYMSQDEIDAFRQSVGYENGGADPVVDVLNDTATMVRGYCRVKLDNSNPFTIPQSLLSSAMVVARYRMLTRMPLPIEDSRKEDYTRAMEHLALVSEGKVLVESPDGDEDDSARVVPLWGLSFRPNLLR